MLDIDWSSFDTPDPVRKPQVGDMVHFVDPPNRAGKTRCMAAVVTHVWAEEDILPDEEILPGVPGSEWIAAHVMGVTGCLALPSVCHDEVNLVGRTWHWLH